MIVLEGREVVAGLRQWRKQIGMTQGQVARAMGVTQSAVAKLERSGDATLNLEAVAAYADAVGLGLRVSFWRKDRPGHGLAFEAGLA